MITELDKNTALVLIDLQKGVIEMPLAHPVQTVLTNTAKLVEAFRRANLPVVVVNVNAQGAAWTKARKEPSATPARQYKEGWTHIAPEIKTEPGDIFITKTTWSAFYNTELDNELKRIGVTGIVFAGVSTSIGVEGTARGASERGYNLTFVSDAMTDMFIEAHERSMKYIFPRIGEIDVTDKVISTLQQL